MVDELIRRTLAGDEAAWRALWRAAEPTVFAVTGRFRLVGPLCRSEDDRRNIVTKVMDRLRAEDFRRLRAFQSGGGGGSFTAWLATVTTRVALDYVRAHPEYTGRGRPEAAGRWVELRSLDASTETDRDAASPDRLLEASLLLDEARRALPRDQLAALYLWLAGEDFAAIAARLSLADAAEARRVTRRALKRLRDRHAAGAPAGREELS